MTRKNIAWITDSTSCLSFDKASEHHIHVIPVSVIFGEEIYKDGIDISVDEFYEKLNRDSQQPTTSQPSPAEFAQYYENLKKEYDCGIAVHVSGKLSGTLNSSRIGAEMAGFPLHIVDSKITSDAMNHLLYSGIEWQKDGLAPEQIASKLSDMADRVKGIVCVGNLDQLHKGGRLSGASFFLGNLLQIKPILTFDEGSLVPLEKVRTQKKADERVFALFDDSYERCATLSGVSVVYSGDKEKAEKWQQLLTAKYGMDVTLGQLSPAIGVHVGAGTIGILWFEN
ncbi:DegV family protein [Fictibacillus iocasae]|uniref:DegV family protein n=1 Tax=Fictibacillus iocasae TaxID=2715437 RepID=A0ABW2NTJ9_9BACL